MNRMWRCCCLLGSFLLLSPAISVAAEADWIWSAENAQQAEPKGDCYFRRTFDLKTAPVQSALVEITGDDTYELYVNGQRLGAGTTWQQIDRYDIRPQLVSGQNVIAVRGSNQGGAAGMVARVHIKTEGAATLDLSTDARWKASLTSKYGWNKIQFSGAAWQPAYVYGPLGKTGPWGTGLRVMQSVKTVAAKIPAAHGKPGEAVKFELRDGDRVVLLGNTLIERDQRFGYLETALTERYPGRNIQFRNLGWSGDTVWGEARAQFGSAADGFRALAEHVAALHPTVILVSYGTNESFAGEAGLQKFLDGLNTLFDTLDENHARIVVLSPLREENLGAPLPDPAPQNARLALYCTALKDVAAERGYGFVDLYDLLIPAEKSPINSAHALTSDEMHLNERGYHDFAEAVTTMLLGPAHWSLKIDAFAGKVDTFGNKATDLVVARNKVRLTLTDNSLPLPPPRSGSNGETPATTYLSYADRVVQILGLKDGDYRLAIDGQPIFTASAGQLSKGVTLRRGPSFDAAERLRETINHKNQLYFNRWRPQNVTYLFLFRKGEQGQNAIEIPKFDPLVEKLEQDIAQQRVPKPQIYELSPVEEASK